MYSTSTPFSEYAQIEQSKYPELTIEAIETLKNELKGDRKLPHITDKMFMAFLHSCYFDIELAKFTIKKCYSYFFDIPQLFCYIDPLSDDIIDNYKCLGISQMPCSNTDKREQILFMKLIDDNPSSLDFMSFFKYLVMLMKYTLLTYGSCDGIIAVVDSTGLSWRHIIKLPIGVTAKILKFLELGLPIRLKTIHFINAGTATQMLMKIIARFANENLMDKIKVHAAGSEEIFNYVPRNMLPVDVGGTGKSHIHYNDELYKNMVEKRDFFLRECEVLTVHITNMQ